MRRVLLAGCVEEPEHREQLFVIAVAIRLESLFVVLEVDMLDRRFRTRGGGGGASAASTCRTPLQNKSLSELFFALYARVEEPVTLFIRVPEEVVCEALRPRAAELLGQLSIFLILHFYDY